MDEKNLIEIYKDLPNCEMWVNEALFGYKHIESYLEKLPHNANVLEIGSGSGILLSIVKNNFPNLNVSGMEPYSDGFDNLKTYHKKMAEDGIVIDSCGYEDFNSQQEYDVIFLINVFEHLPDWKDFLDFTKRFLKPKGVCVILCPNYSFPYESHFKLPVIFNKEMTYKVFKNKITKFEEDHDCNYLWNSLNFVKMPDVRKASKEKQLKLYVDETIVSNMVERLSVDQEFRNRQKAISFFARLVKSLGLLKLLKIPFFQNFSPYMKLEVRR